MLSRRSLVRIITKNGVVNITEEVTRTFQDQLPKVTRCIYPDAGPGEYVISEATIAKITSYNGRAWGELDLGFIRKLGNIIDAMYGDFTAKTALLSTLEKELIDRASGQTTNPPVLSIVSGATLGWVVVEMIRYLFT